VSHGRHSFPGTIRFACVGLTSPRPAGRTLSEDASPRSPSPPCFQEMLRRACHVLWCSQFAACALLQHACQLELMLLHRYRFRELRLHQLWIASMICLRAHLLIRRLHLHSLLCALILRTICTPLLQCFLLLSFRVWGDLQMLQRPVFLSFPRVSLSSTPCGHPATFCLQPAYRVPNCGQNNMIVPVGCAHGWPCTMSGSTFLPNNGASSP